MACKDVVLALPSLFVKSKGVEISIFTQIMYILSLENTSVKWKQMELTEHVTRGMCPTVQGSFYREILEMGQKQ